MSFLGGFLSAGDEETIEREETEIGLDLLELEFQDLFAFSLLQPTTIGALQTFFGGGQEKS